VFIAPRTLNVLTWGDFRGMVGGRQGRCRRASALNLHGLLRGRSLGRPAAPAGHAALLNWGWPGALARGTQCCAGLGNASLHADPADRASGLSLLSFVRSGPCAAGELKGLRAPPSPLLRLWLKKRETGKKM